MLLPLAERIRCHPFSDYATYVQRLGEADIGLAALEPGLHTDAKSAIRWMEFSLCGLASVLSPTATYTALLEDGVHARFARGTRTSGWRRWSSCWLIRPAAVPWPTGSTARPAAVWHPSGRGLLAPFDRACWCCPTHHYSAKSCWCSMCSFRPSPSAVPPGWRRTRCRPWPSTWAISGRSRCSAPRMSPGSCPNSPSIRTPG